MSDVPTLIIADPPPPAKEWPRAPYKGLNYYGPEDVPIFAGRREDLSQCARLVAATSTRLFVLHGGTGCGKSSFLRAGLIPFLEQRGNDFLFVRHSESKQPYFIRCTDDPLSRLAEAIHEVSKGARVLTEEVASENPTILKFSEVLQTGTSLSQFITQTKPTELVALFSRLAARLPETLIVVLDQAEEVFTLKPGQRGEGERKRFFEFMHSYLRTKMDLKIILALRTEYFGRLLARLRRNAFDAAVISDYLLTDLADDQLLEAIVRPSSSDDVDGYGAPRDVYKFKYAGRVAQGIARDLQQTVASGGILPVMQLVCSRLYADARAKNDADAPAKDDTGVVTISRSDYERLGGVEGQVEAHVRDALGFLCRANGVPKSLVEVERLKWRKALLVLAKTQVDGTVTTELVPRIDLEKRIGDANSAIKFTEGNAKLLDEWRVIRPVGVYNASNNKEIPCFVLGHDVIGLALKNWTSPITSVKLRFEAMRRTSRWMTFVTLLLLPGYVAITRRATVDDPIIVLGVFYAVMFLVLSTKTGLNLAGKGSVPFIMGLAAVASRLGFRKAADRYEQGAANLRALVDRVDSDAGAPQGPGPVFPS
jgi:hypothetical protein